MWTKLQTDFSTSPTNKNNHVDWWHLQPKDSRSTQEKNLCFIPVWRRNACRRRLLPARMLWHVPESLCFYCVRERTYLQLGPLICTRYSYLTQCTASLKRRVDSSLPACARTRTCVCVCGADLQDECRPKHKSGSGLCPSHRYVSDYHMVPLQLQGHNT